MSDYLASFIALLPPAPLSFTPAWSALLLAWPFSERLLFTALLALANWLLFLLPAWSQFLLLDRLEHWKINPKDPPMQVMKDCAKRTTVGSLIFTPLFFYAVFPKFVANGMESSAETLPAASKFCFQLFACTLINDLWFYWFHRLLHHPKLYWIHKRHHAFHEASIIFAAMYAHGIEALLTGIIPVFMGPLLFRSHMATVVAWYALRVWEGVQAHCGMQFPFSVGGVLGWPFPIFNNNKWHDYHHTHNNGNYGVELMDWLFGTDKKYYEWAAAKEKAKKA
jgi:sterol desaturase/sphingolipid hydroxylase (fatty acid hydroxylase superfamily)